jgi:hypothetical protein
MPNPSPGAPLAARWKNYSAEMKSRKKPRKIVVRLTETSFPNAADLSENGTFIPKTRRAVTGS